MKYAFFRYRKLCSRSSAIVIAEVEEVSAFDTIPSEFSNALSESLVNLMKKTIVVIRKIPEENIIPAWLFEYLRFEEIDSEYGKIISVVHVDSGRRAITFEYDGTDDIPFIEADNFEAARLYYEINNNT